MRSDDGRIKKLATTIALGHNPGMALRIRSVTLLLAATITAVAGIGDSKLSAADLLQAKGLTFSAGYWSLPAEIELRKQIAALEVLERRLTDTRRAIDQQLEVNEGLRVKLSQAVQEHARLRGLIPATKAGSPQRKQLDADLKGVTTLIDQLRQSYLPSERLGVGPPLRPLNLELVNIRTEMSLRLLPLRGTLEKLLRQYELLNADATVTAAIAAARPNSQLGPASATRDAGKTLDRLHAVVFPDWLPVYRDGNLYRVTALVNEQQPLTFSFGDTGQQTVIPYSEAEAAGIKLDDAAPRMKFRVAAGRDEMVRVVKIPRLRFGRVILTNVEAGILPPEAAEVGARIGPSSFQGHGVHLDTQHLSLYIPGSRG